jgi:hypothetical protein
MSNYTIGTLTEQSRPKYASPSPVKMKLFQKLDPGIKTPIFDLPSENFDNGLKPKDCITPMQLHEVPKTAQLSEYETVQLQQQDVQDMARANLERVHIFLKKYDELTDELAEIEKKTFKDEILKSFKPDQQH